MMKRGITTLILVLVILTAGCAGLGGDDASVSDDELPVSESGPASETGTDEHSNHTDDDDDRDDSEIDDNRDSSTDTDTETDAGNETATEIDESDEPAVPDANPYGKTTLVVAYNDSAVAMDKRHIVNKSVTYWETYSETYAGYPIEYELNQSHSDPDIQITFVDSLEYCGETFNTTNIGCADYITSETAVPDPVEITVEAGYTNTTLLNITKHELGHTLGLTHDDEPQPIMAAQQEHSIVRNVDLQVKIDSGYNQHVTIQHIETALETWDGHLDSMGHDVSHSVTIVTEFDGSADIAYHATDTRDVCDGELVCFTDETEAGDVLIQTEYIYDQDHELVIGDLYGWFQYLEVDEYPPEYRVEEG